MGGDVPLSTRALGDEAVEDGEGRRWPPGLHGAFQSLVAQGTASVFIPSLASEQMQSGSCAQLWSGLHFSSNAGERKTQFPRDSQRCVAKISAGDFYWSRRAQA